MKKALLLYGDRSGHGQMLHHHQEILEGLKKAFEVVDEAKTTTSEEGRRLAKEACGVYDALIIAGGDGTFFNAINALAKEENPPILGYINNGTIGDVGRNFGVGGSYRKALKIIQEGNVVPFDICQANDVYFAYTASIGAYADIPYRTPRNRKKRFGRLSYYLLAFKTLFKRVRLHAIVETETETYEQDVPFLLLMNGRNIGGFRVNKAGNIYDGQFEIYLAKTGLFNGLLQYFFALRKVKRIRCKKATIRVEFPDCWDLDGEAGPIGELQVNILPAHLKVFADKKIKNA